MSYNLINRDPIAKVGMRIRMGEMDGGELNPVDEDLEGTIHHIDDIGTLHVKWDDGRYVGVIPNVDTYQLLPAEDEQIGFDVFESNDSGAIKKIGKPVLSPSTSTPAGKKVSQNWKSSLSKSKIKLETEEDIEETMTAGGGGGLAGASGYAYTPKLESKVFKIKDLIKEETTTKNTDYTTGIDVAIWADKNKDGWNWNDKPLWRGGEIVDILAKISATWDDNNLDISKEWDKSKRTYISEVKDKTIHTKKWDRCVKDVENKNKENNTDYNPYAVCTDSIGYEGSVKKSHRRKKDIEETTTFGSVFQDGNFPVGPAFAAKKGQHGPSKKPIWKGGKIIQKIQNDGVLNENKEKSSLFTEINKVKWVKGGKYVKIKDRCTKYNNQPWCSQGAIDKPLELSDSTFENVKNISNKTGLSEKYIIEKIVGLVNEDTHHNLSLLDRLKIKMAGIGDDQVIYNLNNNLPIDWKGTKEGYYEKMEPTNLSTGSN
jgi:hypothetical protein